MTTKTDLLIKAHTTKVALAISVAIGYWLQLPPAEQQALIATYPWLKHFAPLATFGAFAIARLWPQGLQMPSAPAEPEPPVRGLTVEETRTVLEAAQILKGNRK